MGKTFTVRGIDNLCALTSIERHLKAIIDNPIDAKERCHKIDNLMRFLQRNGQHEAYNALLFEWRWLKWQYPDTAKPFIGVLEENRRILGNELEARMNATKEQEGKMSTPDWNERMMIYDPREPHSQSQWAAMFKGSYEKERKEKGKRKNVKLATLGDATNG